MGLDVQIKSKLKHFDLGVSFSCKEGKLLVIVGPSGAGKTTIIRTIAGLQRPDEGKISYNDEIWTDTKRGIHVPPQKRGIGYVFQEFSLFPHLSVYKNVAFAAKDENAVEELLRLFDIWHLREYKPGKISGGERQRCAICQALARSPKVLLMDEPFSALDALTRRKLREMVKSIKHELHIPIIYVTHDIREALFLADDIFPVVQGKAVNKWIMQFMFAARDFNSCRNIRVGFDGDDEVELEKVNATMEVL